MRNKRVVAGICLFLALLMVVTVVLSVLGSTAKAVSKADIDVLQKQKEAVAAQRAEMQQNINQLLSEKSGVLEQKQVLDDKNELARQEIELINEQIGLFTSLIKQKEEELEKAKAAEKAQYDMFKSRVRAMEENGSYTYLALLFKAKSLSDLLTNIDMVSEIMTSDKRLYDKYTEARANTETVKAEYEHTLGELGEKEKELEAEKAKLEKEIEAAIKVITDLESNIAEHEAVYAEAKAKEAEIQSQMNKIAAQLKAQEEAARRAALAAQQQYTGAGSTATGSYTWPVPASNLVTSPYGNRVHPISGQTRFHAGIDIGAGTGSAVVAADSGTVSVATNGGGYGNYIMIYHSNGNYTLYAHLHSMSVSVGQSVTKGQTIGGVGSTGYSTGPHLHFEVRVNGGTVNPLQYFSGYSMWNG